MANPENPVPRAQPSPQNYSQRYTRVLPTGSAVPTEQPPRSYSALSPQQQLQAIRESYMRQVQRAEALSRMAAAQQMLSGQANLYQEWNAYVQRIRELAALRSQAMTGPNIHHPTAERALRVENNQAAAVPSGFADGHHYENEPSLDSARSDNEEDEDDDPIPTMNDNYDDEDTDDETDDESEHWQSRVWPQRPASVPPAEELLFSPSMRRRQLAAAKPYPSPAPSIKSSVKKPEARRVIKSTTTTTPSILSNYILKRQRVHRCVQVEC